MRFAALLLCALLPWHAHPASQKPLLTIVIDDIGYKQTLAEGFIALPLELTFAVLPQAPHGQALARKAWLNGREFMLHIPMATRAGGRLDAGGLYESMSSQQIQQTLNRHLDHFPRASGINNHMGSRLTELQLPMRAVMETLAKRHLYFLDSRTSAQSVALQQARLTGLSTIQRDIFLDNDPSPAAVSAQLDKALKKAHEQGYALAIGHPHPGTLAVLKARTAELNQTVKLVPASHLMRATSRIERDFYHNYSTTWPLKTPWSQASGR